MSLGSYHFLAHGGGGGCGRNGMKDSVKFLIPPGSSRKIVDPPSRADMQSSLPLPAGVRGCCKVPRAEP